ncbi:hypothetical protein D3C85_1717980 [compost metagenome]
MVQHQITDLCFLFDDLQNTVFRIADNNVRACLIVDYGIGYRRDRNKQHKTEDQLGS